MFQYKTFQFGTALTAAALAAVITAGTAQACYTAAERQAAAIRQVHSDFMVAALHCRHRPGQDLTADYNRYVNEFTPEIVAQTRVLKTHFKKQHGQRYLSQFDRYVTSLANDGSRRANKVKGFCSAQRSALRSVVEDGREGLKKTANRTRLRALPELSCPVPENDPVMALKPKADPTGRQITSAD
ncbi:MAG: hypothetical protein RLN77_00620 [Rhodospirillales bacterium]